MLKFFILFLFFLLWVRLVLLLKNRLAPSHITERPTRTVTHKPEITRNAVKNVPVLPERGDFIETDGRVIFEEGLLITIGSWLIKNNFTLCSQSGYPLTLTNGDAIGLAVRNPAPVPHGSKMFHVGTLRIAPCGAPSYDYSQEYFDWEAGYFTRGKPLPYNGETLYPEAKEKNWIFEIYGRKYVPVVKKLCEELSRVFDVSIKMVLLQEQQRLAFF